MQPEEEEGLMEQERLAVEEGEGEVGETVPYAHRDIKPGMQPSASLSSSFLPSFCYSVFCLPSLLQILAHPCL